MGIHTNPGEIANGGQQPVLVCALANPKSRGNLWTSGGSGGLLGNFWATSGQLLDDLWAFFRAWFVGKRGI